MILYGKISKNYEVMILQTSDQFLCIILSSTDFHCIKFVRCNIIKM
jgi:hypothetical protein